MSAVVTPCRGRGAVYDAISNPHTSTERRREARQIAARLCGRCPISDTCTARVTPPAEPRIRKAKTMPEPQPAPTAPRPVPAPPATAPGVVGTQELIAWGQRHHSSRAQTLAARAATALTELSQLREKDREVTAAEREVKQLQEQLSAAQSKLRKAKGGPTAAGATAAGKRSREESLRIRQWARENGHDCPAAGILPRRIVEAYEAAHTGLAASA